MLIFNRVAQRLVFTNPLTQSGKNKSAKEKFFFKTTEEANTPGLPTYFSTGTQGRGKRIDLNRSYLRSITQRRRICRIAGA
ncbi:MAG: hypothetical protein D3916_08270 [Candidatus Electrothrix sp. MAN1_4]|nr:hypothetical protein [Candidatus Electrothrix sp. MAN1_4]